MDDDDARSGRPVARTDGAGPDGAADAVRMTVEITAGATVIEVVGDRDAAVVVRSPAGERIYLPPEDFDRPPSGDDGSSGRQTPYESPYNAARGGQQSPYGAGEVDTGTGLDPTPDGFRIRHPEPVTDLRLLR